MKRNIEEKEKILIIGGGTAGLVAARRLSRSYDVEVFEKSRYKNLPMFNRIPLMIGLLFKASNRYIKTINFIAPKNRMVPYFLSQVLGGSSVMNGCVHVFGDKKKWDRLLERFSINLEELDSSYREIYSKGIKGDGISIVKAPVSNIDRAFIDSLADMGIPQGDSEYADCPSAGPIVNTVKRFFRSSVTSLQPIEDIKVRLAAEVDYLAVNDSGGIVGVVSKDKLYKSSLVLLCAGVIGTNELLMKKALNVSSGLLVDLRLAAGTGIADHANLRVDVQSARPLASLNEISSSLFLKARLFIEHLFGKPTLMRGTGATSAANLDLDRDGEVDTRINLLRFYESGRSGAGLFSSTHPGFSLSITMINPLSRGEISIQGGKCNIAPGYLNDPKDREFMKKALLFTINLLKKKQLSGFVDLIYPEEEISKDIDDFIERNVFSGYHLIGGCANLVNCEFSVKGLTGLYICDASVLDEYPASNIHSTVVLLADLCSKKLLLRSSRNQMS
ncbi:GMC oxidoreductase [Pseudomonadales bacterium]|nr:GMC oxidoreductase [Pseudomonadales bacterium]